MKIIITAEEIINNHGWERFCKSLSAEIDVNQDEFILSHEQALKSGIVGAVEFYTVYQGYYDWRGDWVDEEAGKYLSENKAKEKVAEIEGGDGDVRNDKYEAYYHRHTLVFSDFEQNYVMIKNELDNRNSADISKKNKASVMENVGAIIAIVSMVLALYVAYYTCILFF